MSTSQVLILIFCSIIVILAIWNLIITIQNIKFVNFFEDTKKIIDEKKEKEEKLHYYGRF